MRHNDYDSDEEFPLWIKDDKLYDAMKEVFDFLDSLYIHVKHDWACCRTCGHYELKKELEEDYDVELDEMDYVFYHNQESDRLREGAKKCYIQYRLTEETKKKVVEYAALPHTHLHWDGDEDKTMIISPYPVTD